MSRGMYGTLDTADDLLPCPMCGAPAGYLYPNRNPKDLQIRCSDASCDIRTPPNFMSREAVRAVWNRRAIPQDPATTGVI